MSIARTIALAVAAGLALSACGGDDTSDEGAPAAQPDGQPLTIDLTEQNGSGQTGTATFMTAGANETRVVVEVTSPPAESQPIHIHRGSCAEIDPEPLYGLPNLMNGQTEGTVPAPLEELTTDRLALNAHRSDSQLDLYVACGNLPGSGDAGTATTDESDDGY